MGFFGARNAYRARGKCRDAAYSELVPRHRSRGIFFTAVMLYATRYCDMCFDCMV
jgi:hypothetical protein